MEIIEGFLAITVGLGFFFLGLLIAWPFGWLISQKLDSWPARPMDNQERKAAWALKYHQATPVHPNSWRWRWVEKHGTG